MDDGTCYYPSECWDGSFECNLDDCPPIPGCTDETACNYNITAEVDDGSCTYPEQYCYDDSDNDGLGDPNTPCALTCFESPCPDGCVDDTGDEFPNVPGDPIYGCTDESACNYNPEAQIDDGSCTYPEQYCYRDDDNDGLGDLNQPCELSCPNDPCPDGCVSNTNDIYPDITGEPIYGCMDETKCNYNPDAHFDDGSCITPEVCWDGSEICPSNIITINGPFFFLNCETSVETGSPYCCGMNCNNEEFSVFDGDGLGFEGMYMKTVPSDGIMDENDELPLDMYCKNLGHKNLVDYTIQEYGMIELLDMNRQPFPLSPFRLATTGNSEGHYLINNLRRHPSQGSNQNQRWTIGITYTGVYSMEDTNSTYQARSFVNSIQCERTDAEECPPQPGELELPLLGCTDRNACNFNPRAERDDGSCDYGYECWDGSFECIQMNCPEPPLDVVPIRGCMNMRACNYDPRAEVDDGSCVMPRQCPNGSFVCPPQVCPDILDPPILGCMNRNACNYNPRAELDDGSCYFPNSENLPNGPDLLYRDCNGVCLNDRDNDNVCDEVDDCVGQYDECGVCNGPGAIYYCDTYGGQLVCDVSNNGGPYCMQDIPQNCASSQVCLDGTKVCDLNDCPEVEPPESTSCIGTEIIHSGIDGWRQSFPCGFEYFSTGTDAGNSNFGIRAVCQDGYVLMCNPEGNDYFCETNEMIYITGHDACNFGNPSFQQGGMINTSNCHDANALNYNPNAMGCSAHPLDFSCCEYFMDNMR